MLADENRIDEALDCYNKGKDVRLYRQDRFIMPIKKPLPFTPTTAIRSPSFNLKEICLKAYVLLSGYENDTSQNSISYFVPAILSNASVPSCILEG